MRHYFKGLTYFRYERKSCVLLFSGVSALLICEMGLRVTFPGTPHIFDMLDTLTCHFFKVLPPFRNPR